MFWLGLGKQGRHSVNPSTPSRLELVESLPRARDRFGVRAHELLASVWLLGDQAGPLEDGDVLLHRSEAHRVATREARNRGLVSGAAAQDVATGRVC
jgi:hypothetical protein